MQEQKKQSAAFEKMMEVYFYAYNNDKRLRFHEENEKLTAAPVVFLGDSITDYMDLDVWFPGLYAVNRGISGNTTRDLLRRLKVSVFDAQPRLLVLQIGINDLMNEGRTPDETAAVYRKILEHVKKEKPDLPVLCVSVYPGWDGDPKKASSDGPAGMTFPIAYLADDIHALNEKIREAAERSGYRYADVCPALEAEDGTMRPAYSFDGCHPNAEGYLVIAEQLMPVIDEMLRGHIGRTVPVWGEKIPFNTGGPKAEKMEFYDRLPSQLVTMKWMQDVFGTKVMKDMKSFDTYTWNTTIVNGTDSRYFDDVPGIIPYLCSGSRTGIIVAPGGGFCMKSWKNEGLEIAEFLNAGGISAFVLDYRLDPYRAPAGYLDMQRAVRYVRHHAEEFGLDKDRVGTLGFSAGGYTAGAAGLLLGDRKPEYEGYVQDDVDREDGTPSFMGLIYPVVSFRYNQNMLAALVGKDFFDEEKREELIEKYSLKNYLEGSRIPQFLCYGTKDPLKGMSEYGEILKKTSPESRELVLEGANHGFALREEKYSRWIGEFIAWVRERKG